MLTLIVVADERVKPQLNILNFIKKNISHFKDSGTKINVISIKSKDLKGKIKETLKEHKVKDLPALITKDHVYYENPKPEITDYLKIYLEKVEDARVPTPSAATEERLQPRTRTKHLGNMTAEEFIASECYRDDDDDDTNDDTIGNDREFREKQQQFDRIREDRNAKRRPAKYKNPPPQQRERERDRDPSPPPQQTAPVQDDHERYINDPEDRMMLAKIDF